MSILPALLGREQKVRATPIYFEIYQPYFQQSVRLGDWKGYRTGAEDPLELYDLKADPKEAKNIAAAHPDIVKQIEAIMAAEHSPSPHYTAPKHKMAQSKKQNSNASLTDLLDDN
jgi:arylsulfatase A-like enzyme